MLQHSITPEERFSDRPLDASSEQEETLDKSASNIVDLLDSFSLMPIGGKASHAPHTPTETPPRSNQGRSTPGRSTPGRSTPIRSPGRLTPDTNQSQGSSRHE